MAYNDSSQSSVTRQVVGRIGWKLLIVLLAVAAFFGLNRLQGEKTSYQKDQAAPLVIGDFNASATRPSGSKPETGRAIGLDYRVVQTLLKNVLYPSSDPKIQRLELEALKTALQDDKERGYDDITINSVQESAVRMRDSILTSISRAATVGDENALIRSLTEGIDEARTSEEKRATSKRDGRINSYKKLSESYANNPKEFAEQVDYKDKNIGDALLLQLKSDTTVANLVQIASDQEQSRLDKHVYQINVLANQNYGKVYSTSFPRELSDYVQKQRAISLDRNDFASRVLDEKRGEYAIYQAGFITCLVLLVFGLLYPIFVLLRLLPPFASSLDPLADQAKAIISGRAAAGTTGSLVAPGIARTLALSVAAVGIGTAVAVANNGASPSSKPPTDVSGMGPLERDVILNARIRKFIDERGRTDNPSPSPTPPLGESEIQTLEARLNARIDGLLMKIPGGGVDPNGLARAEELADVRSQLRDLNLFKDDVSALKNGFKEFKPFYDQNKAIDIPGIDRKTNALDGEVSGLKGLVPNLATKPELALTKDGFEQRAARLETDLFQKLDAANDQILGVRDDSLVASQGTQGRNIMTRAKQLFGGEHYMVTNQSYRVMENLMCEKASPGVPTTETCSDPTARAILTRLREVRGQQATDKSTFLRQLKADRTPWTVALLRYNRLPY